MERTIREQFSDMAVVLSIKEPNSKPFYDLYIEMVEFLYNLDGLYVILSKDYVDYARGISIPLELKKDNFPGIYVFTDLELAQNWCKHYHYYMKDDTMPIAYLPKDNSEFMYIFQTAFQLGVYKVIVNEGDRMLSMNTADMIKVNKMDQNAMVMKVEQIEQKLINKEIPKIPVRFTPMSVVDYDIPEVAKQYIADIRDKAIDSFKEKIKDIPCEVVAKGKKEPNSAQYYVTIFFNTKEDMIRVLQERKISFIEKSFFDTVKELDEKSIFDPRYSYIRYDTRETYPTNEDYFNEK